MGFSTEVLLLVVIGFLVLGPKRMQEVVRQAARLKAKLQQSTSAITSGFSAEIEGDANPRN
jgi:Sec-independent protein translocase protein TatA